MSLVARLCAAVLFAVALLAGSADMASAATDKCSSTGRLDPGTGNDLLIDKYCTVGAGTYRYGNVNIVNGGALVFVEPPTSANIKIEFWASSILIEYGGSLTAGAADAAAAFGVKGGTLTIHLYGAEPPINATGGKPSIACVSANGHCGIPDSVWNAKCTLQDPPDPSCVAVDLPGGAPIAPVPPGGAPKPLAWPTYSDIFYQYESLPYDDVNGGAGLFGYKVLAVSEGGTLQLFGSKGAYYGAVDLQPKQSGESWTRLDGTILNKAQSLKLATPAPSWRPGDHILVTTTDYLPNHSEELVITEIAADKMTIGFTRATCTDPLLTTPCDDPTNPGVQWTHNGEKYDLTSIPATLNINEPDGSKKMAAETRAAVGLLSRSIRIVSEGDSLGQCFAPSVTNLAKGCRVADPRTNYVFGGHTVARQGFAAFQVQGVEFHQLGQGGRLAHYPVHFHLARKTPPNTFIKDSSINESMTRWVTLHGSSGVLVERNVGYLSIGHGFYLEDAVETENQLYSNLGVFARAGVTNSQNPRNAPGILADPYTNGGPTKYNSDKDSPAVFWITHGWNDFQGNMAAPACAGPASGRLRRRCAARRKSRNGPPMRRSSASARLARAVRR